MNCMKPKAVPNPKYPGEQIFLTVPCGKCAACVSNRITDWAFRLEQENKYSDFAYFVTQTYELEPEQPSLHHIQNYYKYVRKLLLQDETIKYFHVSERGEQKNRVHYHAIVFVRGKRDFHTYSAILDRCWTHGFSFFGSCTPASIRYVCKYLHKATGSDNIFTCSNGLGKEWLTPTIVSSVASRPRRAVVHQGRFRRVPRYYIKKFQEEGVLFPTNPLLQIKQIEDYVERFGEYDNQVFWKGGKAYVDQVNEFELEKLSSPSKNRRRK